MGRKRVTKRNPVTTRNSDGSTSTGWETVYEWVDDDSGNWGSDSSSSDSSSD